jgi:hypothetical protein
LVDRAAFEAPAHVYSVSLGVDRGHLRFRPGVQANIRVPQLLACTRGDIMIPSSADPY